MSDTMTTLGVATGDAMIGTPGIAPEPAPSKSYFPAVERLLHGDFAGALAAAGAELGAAFGAGPPAIPTEKLKHPAAQVLPTDEALKAGQKAATDPLRAPKEQAAKVLTGLDSTQAWQKFAVEKGRIVGIYGLFLVMGIIGLVFLLLAARGGR